MLLHHGFGRCDCFMSARQLSSTTSISFTIASPAKLTWGFTQAAEGKGYLVDSPILAATNKSLAKTNKPRTGGEATKQRAMRLISEIADSLGDTMTKPKTWDLGSYLDADWPSQQPITVTDLVAERQLIMLIEILRGTKPSDLPRPRVRAACQT
jgi:hypothetical protein